jgi:hypothetical protein
MALGIDRLVSLVDREVLSRSEFFNSMIEALGNLSAGEKQAILGSLASHNSEIVREEIARLQPFVRNQELSRDFEHVQRNSPLRPGTRIELFRDDVDSSDNRPAWLRGQECCGATFVRFECLGKNLTPVAFVEFDESIDMPGHQGRYGVLFTRYGGDHPAWALSEASVAFCVVEVLPNNLEGFCDSHPFTERHACYRVTETPGGPGG